MTTEIDSQFPTKALLQLCKRLERAWNLSDILNAFSPVALQVLGYPHSWLAVVNQDRDFCTIVSHMTAGGESELSRRTQSMEIPIAGDAMMLEIVGADHVVVGGGCPHRSPNQ